MSPSELFPKDGEILSVSVFVERINAFLKAEVPSCWIRGEISNLRQQSSGHAYFSIKDERSQVSVVLFKGVAGKYVLKDGNQILLYGESSVYEPRGQFQIIGRHVLEDGKGALQQTFEKLKEKLQGEGLFDADRKKPIPPLPKRIAVVTSPTGAAIRDFIEILRRREWKGEIVLFPCQVQGSSAHLDIIEKINQAERFGGCDLLVIMRGGGSLEDLWCFNEEALVRRIANCTLPTISAIGHQIDFVLCDFAADLRAETPSAAAEWISSHYIDALQQLQTLEHRLDEKMTQYLQKKKHGAEILREQLLKNSPVAKIEYFSLKLDDLQGQLQRQWDAFHQKKALQLESHRNRFQVAPLQRAIADHFKNLTSLKSVLTKNIEQGKEEKRSVYASKKEVFQHLHFENTLKRGYCLAQDVEGSRVTSVHQLLEGQTLDVFFQDGHSETIIERIFPKKNTLTLQS